MEQHDDARDDMRDDTRDEGRPDERSWDAEHAEDGMARVGATRDDGGLRDLENIAADYAVIEQIGRGSSGVVWRARDLALDRDVAIKVVRGAPGDDDLLERSAQEARLVARLPHHPNIVAIHAVRRLGPRSLALVMQFVSGGTLRDRLVRDGALPPADATAILRDLARALHFAHGAGIVHRDVKPENVYLDAATGRALLSDFGAATLLHADSRRTAIGAVIGTPAYMSPEQLASGTVDGRSDLYSLGLVGWEMLTGRFPWGSANLYEILYRQRHTELAPVDTLRPELPAPIVSAVEGALERDPARRWPSAATFLAALLAPEDAPRHVRHVVGDVAPAGLATEAAGEQHARTLRLTTDGAEEVGIAAVARQYDAAEHASARTDIDDGVLPVPAPADDDSVHLAAADAAAVTVPDDRDADDHHDVDGDDDWRPDARDPAWRAALAAMPASPRRRVRTRMLAALVGAVGAAALVGALALQDDPPGVGEVAAREVAGDVEDERALARDLAATAGILPDTASEAAVDSVADSVAAASEAGPRSARTPLAPMSATPAAPAAAAPSAPAESPAPARGSIAARCASTALADQRACLLARLAVHDERLNATYADLVRALRVRDGGRADGPDTRSVRRLRERQRAWIMGRDRACRDAGVARAGVRWAERRAQCLGQAGDRWTTMLARELAAARGD